MPNGDSGPSWADSNWEKMRNAFRRLLVQLVRHEASLSVASRAALIEALNVYEKTAFPYDAHDRSPRSDEEIEAQVEADRRRHVRGQISHHEEQIARLRAELDGE